MRLERPLVSFQEVGILDTLFRLQPNTFLHQRLVGKAVNLSRMVNGTGRTYRCHSGCQRLQACKKSMTESHFVVFYGACEVDQPAGSSTPLEKYLMEAPQERLRCTPNVFRLLVKGTSTRRFFLVLNRVQAETQTRLCFLQRSGATLGVCEAGV